MKNLRCFIVDFFVVKLYMLIAKNKSHNTKRYRMKGHTNDSPSFSVKICIHTYRELLFQDILNILQYLLKKSSIIWEVLDYMEVLDYIEVLNLFNQIITNEL